MSAMNLVRHPAPVAIAGTAGYVAGCAQRSLGGRAAQRWDILDAFREQWLVVDRRGNVIRQGRRLDALGLARDGRLAYPEISALADAAREAGESVETNIELNFGESDLAQRDLLVKATPIREGDVLVLIDDRTYDRRVEEARRDFVANVSHELKTPVGGLRLLAEAIEDAADDTDAVKRFAGRMRVESVRLTKLVQDIVDFSRLQVSDPVQSAVVTDLYECAQRAVAEVWLLAQDREISVSVEHGDGATVVLGDSALLITAIRNLLTNAINYSESGTAVSVAVLSHEDDVIVRVQDQGIGIAPSDQPRLFERFYRVDPARSRQTGGTGLGLAIVKHVVANHDGRVRVSSEPGRGSTFEISIPAHRGGAVPLSKGTSLA